MNTIRIKKDSGGLSFEIIDQVGAILATSVEFRSICRVEDALRRLGDSAAEPEKLHISTDGCTFEVSKISSRQKVKFKRISSEADLRIALDSIKDALILDSRPANQKRTDIGGTLKSLI